MALWVIGILAILIMIATCLPVARKWYCQYIAKLRYWSLLAILIIYFFVDIWLWLKTSNRSGDFWLTFIMSNVAGIVALIRTYLDVKNSK